MVENPMINYRESKPKVVAHCVECRTPLYAHEEILAMDGEYFCEESCLKLYMNVKTVEGWEIDGN